jgi:predicted cupin superfamily sugar epimerase
MVELSSAADIIARLELKPHPEGGHYRETFRDARVDANGRSLSTAIHFLLARGERAHWHRIDAVEIWHYYAGHALSLQIADDRGQRSVRLGPDLAAGEVPQAVVPVKAWQAAEKHRRLDAGGLHGRTRL